MKLPPPQPPISERTQATSSTGSAVSNTRRNSQKRSVKVAPLPSVVGYNGSGPAPSGSFAPWIDALPPELRSLLQGELAAGNRIRFAAGCGLEPQTQVFVLLDLPFFDANAILPNGVQRREASPNAEWLLEYVCEDGAFVLACAGPA